MAQPVLADVRVCNAIFVPGGGYPQNSRDAMHVTQSARATAAVGKIFLIYSSHVDTSRMVELYHAGLSLRTIGRMAGVSRSTVMRRLQEAGVVRRRTEEPSQRRWPRVNRICTVCGREFSVRQGRLKSGDATGLYCSVDCRQWAGRERGQERALRELAVEVVYR